MADKKLPLKKGGKSAVKAAFDLTQFKKTNNFDHKVKEKELTWIPMSEAFTEATKLGGMARGYVQLYRGFSNTGKSTAIYEAMAGAQQIGDLPVIIETEGNWNWEHAINIGVQAEEVVDEETVEIDYQGDFLLFRAHDLLNMFGKYDYSESKEKNKMLRTEAVIEDVAALIDLLLLKQANGELPRNLVFLWDSIGTLNCFKGTQSKANNNMWNAGAMKQAFNAIASSKITASRAIDSEYINTFGAVQKIWLDSSGMGQPMVKHSGGEFMFYAARLIVHFGGVQSHGTTKLTATSGGKQFLYGTEVKVKVEKNHITGIQEEGKICSTPHGYVSPNKLDEYKKEKREWIKEMLSTEFDDIQFGSEEVYEIE